MRPKRNKTTAVIGLVLLAIGLASGFYARPYLMPVEAVTEDMSDDTEGHGGENILELVETTVQNMELKTGKFEVRDFFEKVVLPATFVERLPDGRHEIVAPIGGQVQKVYVSPGQAVSAGAPMFELRVTDEQVSAAQVELLTVMSDIDSNLAQLERSRRLAQKEIIAGKQVIELELKLKQLNSSRKAIEQELLLRGLTPAQLQDLVNDQTLVSSLTIYAPEIKTDSSDPDRNMYTVETLDVLKGKNIARGEQLCQLTHHGQLLIKGMAFESDIEKIVEAEENGWKFTAQIGETGNISTRENLSLHSVDNHVDPESQTYSVYVSIDNEVLGKNVDLQNRPYIQWRFKTGQRAHLECPIGLWQEQVVVPIEALVQEGPEAFVFKKFDHTHETDDGNVILEFEKIPVKVLHTDRNFAVLKKQVTLDTYEQYALNRAFQLNLALKQAASGGGGHSHSHAGHSH